MSTNDEVLDAWGELNCMDDWNVLPSARLIELIEAAQSVQKRTRPSAAAWQAASVTIHSLAPILAARQKAGTL